MLNEALALLRKAIRLDPNMQTHEPHTQQRKLLWILKQPGFNAKRSELPILLEASPEPYRQLRFV
jgi:hypothetical protein